MMPRLHLTLVHTMVDYFTLTIRSCTNILYRVQMDECNHVYPSYRADEAPDILTVAGTGSVN
jgi:hypothetical protein